MTSKRCSTKLTLIFTLLLLLWPTFCLAGTEILYIYGQDNRLSQQLVNSLQDTDADGLPDTLEYSGCTDVLNPDSDMDNLLDGAEDSNADGVVDPLETNPCLADTDGDGMPDGFEVTYRFDPLDAADGDLDFDSDGLTNSQEFALGTDPDNLDTDGDGVHDGVEVGISSYDLDPSFTTNPLLADSDNDGLTDGQEDANGNGQVDSGETNPAQSDLVIVLYPSMSGALPVAVTSMGGGVSKDNQYKVSHTLGQSLAGRSIQNESQIGLWSAFSAFNDNDKDNDGLLDHEEDLNENGIVDAGETDPYNPDTDGDGIQDGTESGVSLSDVGPYTDLNFFQPDLDPSTTTDPLLVDSDNDGLTDGQEDPNFNSIVDNGEQDPSLSNTFAANSAQITNPYIPLQNGTRIAYLGDNGTSSFGRYWEGVGIETIHSVQCLQVLVRGFGNDPDPDIDPEWYYLWLAQDVDGAVWLFKRYEGQNQVTKNYPQTDLILWMPAAPMVGQIFAQDDENSESEVLAVDASVPSLSTDIGPYNNAIHINRIDGFGERNIYTVAGLGSVLEEWSYGEVFLTWELDPGGDNVEPVDSVAIHSIGNAGGVSSNASYRIHSTVGQGIVGLVAPEHKAGFWYMFSPSVDTDLDDDGVPDFIEDKNLNGLADIGETDFTNPDTDGDGILDGTELGYTEEMVLPGTDMGVFIADLAPESTTDPLDVDTDGDTLDDGQEDINQNGMVDGGETDPNLADTDGDGIADNVEIANGTDPLVNVPPVANAGLDQNVSEGEVVILDASGSSDNDDGIATYLWTQTFPGTAVTLSDSSSMVPNFTAPDVGISGETLTFELTVTDGAGSQDQDIVQVFVNWVNEIPVADAGGDQAVNEGEAVALDASGSTDSDGGIASYHWAPAPGQTSVVLSDPTAVQPTFTSPNIIFDETLTFIVTVTDGEGAQDQNSMEVFVKWINEPPMVTAFSASAVSSTFHVSINEFTGTDDRGVISYLITESAAIPANNAHGWQPTPHTEYIFSSIGQKRIYAWVQDENGVVSPGFVFADVNILFVESDRDGDGVEDNMDNCPRLHNPSQLDPDNDARGEACDSDPAPNYGSVLDAPHNHTRGIGCNDCHTYSTWWQYSPVVEGSSLYAAITNDICNSCHSNGGEGQQILSTHSSTAMGATHRQALGDWSVQCVDCHNAHKQSQLYWMNTEAINLYLMEGLIEDGFIVNGGQTTFNYTATRVNSEWTDRASWGQKNTFLPASGLILVEDLLDAKNTYEIMSADSSTITVKGGMNPASTGGTFGIIYGQLVRSHITTPVPEKRAVKFFNPKDLSGGFTDTGTPVTGLCQVCHANTEVWNNSGSLTDTPSHTGSGNFNCVTCHIPEQGFGPLP